MSDMRSKCRDTWEALADLAHGEDRPEAAAHVAGCPACTKRLAELRTAIAGLKMGFHDAPDALVEAARAIFPVRQPVMARLAFTSLGAVGARGGEAFQSVFEFEGGSARVMYKPERSGWSVLGRVEPEGWHSDRADLDPHGRFQFSVEKLNDAEIRLWKQDAEVVLPAPNL